LTDSRRIAGLLGPTLIALTASEVVTADIWVNVPATQAYLAGCLWFVAGLSIVRAHNRWSGWPILVTIMAWFALIGGLLRMFAPVRVQQNVPRPATLLGIQLVLFAIGVFLSWKAYGRRDG
jgi:hypothetical protein